MSCYGCERLCPASVLRSEPLSVVEAENKIHTESPHRPSWAAVSTTVSQDCAFKPKHAYVRFYRVTPTHYRLSMTRMRIPSEPSTYPKVRICNYDFADSFLPYTRKLSFARFLSGNSSSRFMHLSPVLKIGELPF